jgi:MFS family permease
MDLNKHKYKETESISQDDEKNSLQIKEKEKEKEILTIDELLNKIGYTRYHSIMFLIVILSLISDGVEFYLIYLISPVLIHINNFPTNFNRQISSILFLGMVIGCLTSGLVSKYLGRKNGLLIYMLLISIFGTLFTSINNLYWFYISRFIVGVCIGYLFNLVTFFMEILPYNCRDFLIGCIFFGVKIGIIYFVLIYYIFSLHSRDSVLNNYNAIVIITSIPMIICLIISFIFLEESPRVLLWDGRYEEAFKVFDNMRKTTDYDFNDEEKRKLINFIETTFEKEYEKITKKNNKNEKKNENEYSDMLLDNKDIDINKKKEFILENKKKISNLFGIFKIKYLLLTILLSFLWSFNAFIVYTSSYALPIYLSKIKEKEYLITNNTNNTLTNLKNNSDSNSDFDLNKNGTLLIFQQPEKIKKILIGSFIPLPAEFISGYLDLRKDLFNKKFIISISFFFTGVMFIFMILFPQYLYIFSSCSMFFHVICFNILKLFTQLAYNTDNRDFGYSFANFSARFTCILVPFIADLMFYFHFYGPIFLMLTFSLLGSIGTIWLYERDSSKDIK